MSTPDPNVRISNAERDAVLQRLQAATEEGRLDLDEFAERSQRVYEAKTYAEVERLLTDLPENAGTVAKRSRANGPVPDLHLSPKHAKVTREGAWNVPARITVRPMHSRIVLDFRHAVFTSPEVAIEAHLTHAGLTIILPKDASAIDDGIDFQGGRLKNECVAQGDGPTIRLTGSTVFSAIKVRRERRFLRWRW
ncbi:DUF1707 SHOCT-like domain-containing protein [Glycomyces harbinensis]|uniref:DUF1707 domain-containing protein n=1 Tax=Glycomyces harbinensis TaxID=58114 RepID=A0A1G6ZZB6_9ACTN|nr:DUF1707 domain-containing protein [Glycomyces harbinensis]SDE06976.1 protein of unknown function [Glycomyces harbinensis]